MDYPRINERELKFPIPCGIIVSGPSSSGKTQLVLRLLSCADEMFEPPPKAIVWAYGEYSAQIPELERQGIIVHAGPPSDEMLNKLPKPFLIVYDDLMGEIDAKKLADLYTKKSHHNNFAVMFLTQNLFDKAMRVPRSNAQYIFLMRAPNDMLSIRNLATQIFPREQGFLIDAYKQACAEPYGYLLKQLIGQRVLENYEYLKTLGKTSSQKKIRHLLSSAGCEELLTLVEICLNILNGSFCLNNKQKQKIAPFANFIRKLARARSEKSARKLVLQSGGSLFAPLLAPILIEAARYLLSGREDGQQTNSAASKEKEGMTKPPATGVQLKPGPEEVEETIVIGGSEADDDETATISTPKFSTPKEVEVGPEPRPSRKRDLKKQEIMAKEQQLLSIIKSDPKRFGVNARDKIINPSTGREFIDFDLARAIERLVNPRPENAPSPSDVQADLADFQALSRKNSGNRYLLLAIDVLSRRMFGAPVKSKKPADMKRAFVELFGQMPKLPETLYTDRGLEFVAKPLKEFYAEKGIKKFETSSKKKAAVAERAIRTLKAHLYKYFSAKNTSTWVDVLAKFLAAINNSVCRATGLRPNGIDEQNAREVWKKVYGEAIEPSSKGPKIKLGENVRIPEPKHIFEKGYMPNYSAHVYTVDERRSSNPEHYFLKDYYGTILKRKFYLPELTKVKVDKNTLYRVEKKYKERMRDGQKEMLVKFIGFPEKYWVTSDDFVEQ
uniref:Integrase catalytic domain-containing protein n=1 Tax=Globodera rostochiensis TaxID=31243 RepID=A0A914H8N6_GLORO